MTRGVGLLRVLRQLIKCRRGSLPVACLIQACGRRQGFTSDTGFNDERADARCYQQQDEARIRTHDTLTLVAPPT